MYVSIFTLHISLDIYVNNVKDMFMFSHVSYLPNHINVLHTLYKAHIFGKTILRLLQ